MHKLLGAVLVVALSASNALAADTAPLAPGRPAGVHQAQIGTGGAIVLGAAVAIGIAAIVATSGNDSQSKGGGGSTTTSSTGT